MAKSNGDLYEDKFARVYAEIVRLDQLRQTDAAAAKELSTESYRRLDQRMDAQETAVAAALAAAEKAVTAALTAADKAVSKAELAQAKVNETQNEFRGTLRDQATAFIPRLETENIFRELRGLITAQNTTITELRSRLDIGPPSLAAIQARSDESVGRRGEASDARTKTNNAWAVALGVVGAVIAAGVFALAIASFMAR